MTDHGSRLRDLIGQLQDAVQQLHVYQMEGEIDGKPYAYVLVRRHEVHQILQATLLRSSASALERGTTTTVGSVEHVESVQRLQEHLRASASALSPEPEKEDI